MVTKIQTAPAEQPVVGAAAPESLADLAAAADLLDTAPAAAAQAVQEAQAAEVALSNEAELFGTLQAVRAMAFPLLSMAVDRPRMQALEQVWNDGVLEQTAKAGAAVLERHGITMGQVMGQFGPYIMLVAAVAPPVMMTKKILSPPKSAVQTASATANGQQQ